MLTENIVLNGGIIDLSGKGYTGYDNELRRGDDGNLFGSNRGGGGYYSNTQTAGGLSSGKIPQSAAHAGYGGGGMDADDKDILKNYHIYGNNAYANTLGSGGGSSHFESSEPTIGGSGGGKIQIRANQINITNPISLISVAGTNGTRIKSGNDGYFAGGSGGSISLTSNSLNINYDQSDGTGGFVATGGYQATSTASSEGSGGYIKISTGSFKVKNVANNEAKLREYLDLSSRMIGPKLYHGTDGQYALDVTTTVQSVDAESRSLTQLISSVNRRTDYPQLDSSDNSNKIFANENMNLQVNVQGMEDLANLRRKPIDLVIVSDLYALNADDRQANLRKALKDLLVQIADVNTRYPNTFKVTTTGIWSEGSGDNKVQTFKRGSNNMTTFPAIIAGLDPKGDPLPNTIAYEATHYESKNLAAGSSFGSGLEEAIRILNAEKRESAQQYILFISPFNELYTPCIARTGEATCANYTIPALEGMAAMRLKHGDISLIHTSFFGKATTKTTEGVIRKKFQDLTNYIRNNSLPTKIKTYYETSLTSELSTVIAPIVDNISGISSGMAIKIQQTLPTGTKIIEEPTLSGKTNSDVYSCNHTEDNTKISCTIYPTAYLADKDSTLDPNKETFSLNFKLNFADVDPGWVDTQQNKKCAANGSELNNIPGSPFSFAEYLPAGLFTGDNIKTTPSSCRQIVPNIISGDVFNSNEFLKNFAFYGNNLNQSKSSTSGVGSSWKIENYTTLSHIGGSSEVYEKIITNMQGEAQNVTADDVNLYSNWYLQGNDLSDAANGQASTFLEGKVWRLMTGLKILGNKSSHSYVGQGTIIVDRDLTLLKGTKITKSSVDNSKNNLGLIVLGNLTLEGDNILEASVYVKGNVTITGKNVKILGSVVASDFVGFDTYGRLDIRYDYKTEDKWPPGFRYLNAMTNTNSAQ